MKFKIITIIAIFLGSVLLYGCHTTSGFGQDVQAGGKAIQRAAS